MEFTGHLACPSCGAALRTRGVRIGKMVRCAACRTAFRVQAEDADAVEETGGVNAARLLLVLLGGLLYLLGGAGLAYYCFTHDGPTPARASTLPSTDALDEQLNEDEPSVRPVSELVRVSVADQRLIDDASARGTWYLRDRQLPEGTWERGLPVGLAALPALTLMECGVPASDPLVQKAAGLVRRLAWQGPPQKALQATYQLALAILFLDRLGEEQDVELIRYLALCLMTGMHPQDGAWHYGCPRLDPQMTSQLLESLQDSQRSLDDWRATALKGKPFNVPGWDNSNTQFAVLALWAAQRHGVPIASTMARVEKHFRATQSEDGSWHYVRGRGKGAWPSMTCSALLGLAVAHGVSSGEPGARSPLGDPAIQRGLGVLAHAIDRPANPPDYYFFWSLERVAVLYSLPKVEGKDWYAWGSKVLLARQQRDGSWSHGVNPGSAPLADTCFALLFLKQANLTRDLTSKLQLLSK
jgi:hypothetical protein